MQHPDRLKAITDLTVAIHDLQAIDARLVAFEKRVQRSRWSPSEKAMSLVANGQERKSVAFAIETMRAEIDRYNSGSN